MNEKTSLNHVLPRRAFLLGCTALVAGCTSQRIAPAASRFGSVGNAGDADDIIMQQAMREATRRLTAKCAQLWGAGNTRLGPVRP
jgi:hypothetical protein